MKKTLAIVALGLALVAPSFAATYSTDFESETVGQLATGWDLYTPCETGQGTMHATVENGPTGGKALKIVMDTDWGLDDINYAFTSGDLYSPQLTGFDAENDTLTYSVDIWRQNWGIKGTLEDTSGTANAWFWDDEANPGNIYCDYLSSRIINVDQGAWFNVTGTFNPQTDSWTTTVTAPNGNASYTSTSGNGVGGRLHYNVYACQWAIKTCNGGEPIYDNVMYLDNFTMSVAPVPEPGSIFALSSGLVGLAGFAIRRRK